jgi:tRNA-dihydrouridine synthase B
MAKIGDIDVGEFPLLLAPMEDVSDPPFRALCKEQGADVVYTEFISSEGLIRDAAKSVMKLDIYEAPRRNSNLWSCTRVYAKEHRNCGG